MEEPKSKYVIGDIVTLIDDRNDLWIVEKVTYFQTKGKDGLLSQPTSYYYLRNIHTDDECQEMDNTILKKDEGANLLYV